MNESVARRSSTVSASAPRTLVRASTAAPNKAFLSEIAGGNSVIAELMKDTLDNTLPKLEEETQKIERGIPVDDMFTDENIAKWTNSAF